MNVEQEITCETLGRVICFNPTDENFSYAYRSQPSNSLVNTSGVVNGFNGSFWLENRRRSQACRFIQRVVQSAMPLLSPAARVEAAAPDASVLRHFPHAIAGMQEDEPAWMRQLRRTPQTDLVVVGAFCDVVTERLAALAGAPRAGEPEWLRRLRGSLRHSAWRAGGREPSARDELLNTATVLWLDAVRPRRRPGECGRSLPEELALALALLRGADAARVLRSTVNDGLRLADDPSLPFRAQQLRQWRKLLDLSLLLLPGGEHDGERCTQSHFAALAAHIRRELPHDKNLPRTVPTIGALFFFFCAPCAGAQSQPDGDDESPVETDDVEQAEAVYEVAPEAADDLAKKAKRLVRVLPPVDQAVLANLLGTPSLIGRAARGKLPGIDDRVLSDRARLTAALGLDERAFKGERDRLWHWWKETRTVMQRVSTRAEEVF